MSKLTDQWIEAFRAGDYGDKGKYTEQDVAVMASSYDPSLHEAPAVIGHPENNQPAYGWVEKAKAVGDRLFVKLRQVQPALEDMVARGMFKKRSVSIYPAFGATGKPYLRHIGFLGAMPPEVKGLADVKFADGQFQEVEFSEENVMTVQEMKDALREIFGGKTPKLFNEDEHKAAIAAAVADATKPLNEKLAAFGEMTPADKQKMADMQKQIDDAKGKMAESATRAAAAVTLAETVTRKLKDARKWLPAFDKMGLPQLFTELAKSEAVISFGEGDKKKDKPMVEVMGDFINGIRQIVPEGELVTASAAAKKATVLKFNESPGIELDQDSVFFAEAAKTLAKEKKITYGEALAELAAEGWKPQRGGASAGAV